MSDETLNPPLVSAGSSDRCPVCGAHLAVDQRYCVECGTRRGAPRFALANPTTTRTTTTTTGGPVYAERGGLPPRRGPVWSGNSTLLVGLLVLLIAMGVGVLIGHNNSAKPSAPRVNVQVNGGGGAAAAAPTSGSTGNSGNTGSSSSTAKTPKAKKKAAKAAAAAVPSAKNTAPAAKGKAATAAAAKSFNKSATQKSTVGGGCTAGTPGCQNGKQTGNLF